MTAGDQDKKGRFVAGNKARRKHQLATTARQRRRAGLARAMDRAVKPAELERMLRTLLASALKGDTNAAKLLIERVYGRPPASVPMHTIAQPLPDVSRPGGSAQALQLLAAAVASGAVDADHAKAVADLVGQAGEAAALADLQRRLDAAGGGAR